MNTKQIGDFGEKQATKYLKKNGYKIIEKNYKNKIGEIDIIAQEKKTKTLCFVEVKAKSSDFFGLPREMVDDRKIFKIEQVATAYLMEKHILDVDFRFDVIEILGGNLTHIKRAW